MIAPARALRHEDHGMLLGQLALVLAPQARTLPVPVSLLLVLLLAWRWLLWRRQAPLPSRLLLGTTAVLVLLGASVAIWRDAGGAGRDLTVALLGAFVILKLLECRALSDATLVTQLSFYLLLTLYLSDQPFWLALYSLAIGAWVLRNWLLLHHPDVRGRLAIWPLLGRMALIGLPWALVLFVLFPRLDHPLWRLPQSAAAARTGISDVMMPGSVGQLIRSSEVAMRAEFEGGPLPPGALYWRALVLWRFDGTSWLPAESRRRQTAPAQSLPEPAQPLPQASAPSTRFTASTPSTPARTVDYTVTLEPSQQHWLFLLDRGLALSANVDVGTSADDEYFVHAPLEQRTRYRARSMLSAAPEPLGTRTRSLALSLPDGNPRARALGERWASEYADPAERVQAALRLFASAPFAYTLSPPPPGAQQIDSFLFDTKRGFCEHYAGSFVFLMRAAGVPARVIAGYLGGEYNPIGHHYIVRQSDAHAWAEVWLEGQGWVRVDPTGAVAPSRVEQGLEAALDRSEASAWHSRQEAAWLRNLRWGYEGLVFTWQRWILQYDQHQQARLLDQLGIGASLAQLLVGTLALLCLLALVPLWRRRRTVDPVDALYARYCRLLARHGCERGAAEGPRNFAERAASRLPQAAPAVQAFADRYIRLRYGVLHEARRAGELAALRQDIHELSRQLRRS